MKNGVILGKFMPLHLGHEHLIQTGLDNCDKLFVVVCSLSNEPIDGNIRYQWMKNRFAKEIDSNKMVAIHLQEDWIPQYPAECKNPEAFFGAWAGIMKGLVKEEIHIMFASEEYVYPTSKYIGCEPFLVDLDRSKFPVSGTLVRDNPFGNWKFINTDVQAYFSKRILIIGGESTGKSTLTSRLESFYNLMGYQTKGVQEFARGWIDSVLDGDMSKLTYDHITMFGKRQMELVEEESQYHQVVFSDTDAIVSEVFQQIYYGKIDPELEKVADKEKWDLILFLMPDVPWVNDGQRNLGHRREEIANNLTLRLGMRKHSPIRYIYGNFEQRWEMAKKEVDKLLKQM